MTLPFQTLKQLAAADADIIAGSQTPAGAGNLTLTASPVELDTPRRVLITTTGDETGITFTITGTNHTGNPLEETVTGVNNTTVATTQDFATVSQIAVSGAAAAAVTVGTNGVGSSPWFALDRFPEQFNVGYGCVVSGTINYTVEYTFDNPNAPWTGTFPTVFASATSAKTDNQAGVITTPCRAMRVTVNSGAGSVAMIAIQSGISGGF